MIQTALPDPIIQEDFYADTPLKRLFSWIIDMIVIILLSAAVTCPPKSPAF